MIAFVVILCLIFRIVFEFGTIVLAFIINPVFGFIALLLYIIYTLLTNWLKAENEKQLKSINEINKIFQNKLKGEN